MNIYNIEYDWYEGEHEDTLVAKDVKQEEFEKDIIEAKKFAESLIGKETNRKEGQYFSDLIGEGYAVECLPEYYKTIIWYLIEKKGYIEVSYNEHYSYDVNDDGIWEDDKKVGRINIVKIDKYHKREVMK